MMKKKKTEPFRPCVSMEEIYAFDPEREETFTRSLLMNAVLTAIKREKLTKQKAVADFLEVNTAHLGGAVNILTGMSYNEMCNQLLRHTVQRLHEEHPDWGKTELARAIGYSDHTALWRLFHREYDHNSYKEWHDKLVKRRESFPLIS